MSFKSEDARCTATTAPLCATWRVLVREWRWYQPSTDYEQALDRAEQRRVASQPRAQWVGQREHDRANSTANTSAGASVLALVPLRTPTLRMDAMACAAPERLLLGPDGLVRIALKQPFSDGTVAVDLERSR